MSLADEITQRRAQERNAAARRADPELEAQRVRLIAESPMLREYYNAMSKEELTAELALAKREHAEMVLCRNREVEQWKTPRSSPRSPSVSKRQWLESRRYLRAVSRHQRSNG
jgi:hypothetical protein